MNRKKLLAPSPARPAALRCTPLHSRACLTFQRLCLNITPAKWTYGWWGIAAAESNIYASRYDFQAPLPRVHCRLWQRSPLSSWRNSPSPRLPSIPSSRPMTSLLTSLPDSQPASGPDYCLELICVYELGFLLFFSFFLLHP